MNTLRLLILGAAGACALAGCGGDDHGGGSNPPPVASMGFEASLQTNIKEGSCENIEPLPVNQVDLTFASDQDTAEPRDISTVTPGCKN